MNRALPTTLLSLSIIAVFLTFMVSVQSCGGSSKETEQSIGDRVDELADTTEEVYFEDNNEATTDDDDTGAGYSDNSGEDGSTSRSSSTSTSTTTPRATSYTSSNSGAGYLVVAGNYLLEDNADEMLSNLKRQGYTGAEKVVFDLSQYYTVIAGRYTSRSSASQAGSELKRKGIDNYVVTKK